MSEKEPCPECGSHNRDFLFYIFNDPATPAETTYTDENSHLCTNNQWHFASPKFCGWRKR